MLNAIDRFAARFGRPATTPRGVLAIWAVVLLLLFVMRAFLFTGTDADDAEQLIYMQSWALGYGARNPPVFTWLVLMVQPIFGVTVASVAFVKFMLLAGSFYLLYRSGEIVLGDRSLAALAALSPIALYYVSWDAAFHYTHSVILAFAVCLTLYQLLVLERRRDFLAYILFGIGAGFGMLSKYNYLIFLAVLIAAVFAERDMRRTLPRPAHADRRPHQPHACRAALFLAMAAARAAVRHRQGPLQPRRPEQRPAQSRGHRRDLNRGDQFCASARPLLSFPFSARLGKGRHAGRAEHAPPAAPRFHDPRHNPAHARRRDLLRRGAGPHALHVPADPFPDRLPAARADGRDHPADGQSLRSIAGRACGDRADRRRHQIRRRPAAPQQGLLQRALCSFRRPDQGGGLHRRHDHRRLVRLSACRQFPAVFSQRANYQSARLATRPDEGKKARPIPHAASAGCERPVPAAVDADGGRRPQDSRDRTRRMRCSTPGCHGTPRRISSAPR